MTINPLTQSGIPSSSNAKWRWFIHTVAAPALFYFLVFCIFTFPLITHFSTHFWGDHTDGMNSAWNLWWMKKAVIDLHQLPWTTNYVYYPGGVSLLTHDVHLSNAIIGAFLQSFLSLQQVFNLFVIIGFTGAGLTAYWLAYYLTKSYPAALFGGFLFAFSSYHFDHLISGHLSVLSIEFIPLFVLSWLWLLKKPSIPRAIASALVLVVIGYTLLYFYLYCAMLGAGIILWLALFNRQQYPIFTRRYIVPLIAFVATLVVLTGPYILSILLLTRRDHIVATHVDSLFSMDLVSLVLPGRGWRFSELTKPHWELLAGNPTEHSIFLGSVVLIMLVYTWRKRRDLLGQGQHINLWYAGLLGFVLLSMGSVIKIWGHDINLPITPYSLLARLVPTFRASGVPVNFTAMTVVCTSVIVALGFSILFKTTKHKLLLAGVILLIGMVDYFPRPITIFAPATSPYVKALRNLPDKGGVLDMVTSDSEKMFNQIYHGKPVALGYVSLFTESVYDKRKALLKLISDHDYQHICTDFNIGYVVVANDASDDLSKALSAVDAKSVNVTYEGSDAKIYELTCD